MWKLEYYKIVFVTAGLVGVLLFASPTLGLILHLPEGERFSELWILGPDHMAEDYPFNVKINEEYLVYVGMSNHMGSSAQYTVYIKFGNQTEPLLNAATGAPSPLPSLFKFRAFIEDGKSWEAPLRFSFSNISFSQNICLVDSLTMNGITFKIDKTSLWDAENKGYYYQLLIELWIYNVESKTFEFHNRFASLWLNMTEL